jgi:hypothetical protein
MTRSGCSGGDVPVIVETDGGRRETVEKPGPANAAGISPKRRERFEMVWAFVAAILLSPQNRPH